MIPDARIDREHAAYERERLSKASPTKVKSNSCRWRVIEAATARGYWGIELEDADNDDDAILYPQKIHRDTVARIVEAHNASISTEDRS